MYRQFTLLELLIVCVVTAVIAAMLLPALHYAKEKAQTISCASVMKQYAFATAMYADDNDNIFPDIRKYLLQSYGFASYLDSAYCLTRCPADNTTENLGRLGSYYDGIRHTKISIGGTVNLSDSESQTSRGTSPFIQSRNDAILNQAPSKRCQWTDYQNQSSSHLIKGAAMSISKGTGSISTTLGEYVYRHPDNSANGAFADGHVSKIRLNTAACPFNNGHDIASTWHFPGNCTWPYGPRQGPPDFPATVEQSDIIF